MNTKEETALHIATKYHEGQYRVTGEPYIFHPVRVALQFPTGDERRIVALLHDVLEDTAGEDGEMDTEIFAEIFNTFGADMTADLILLTRFSGQEYTEFIRTIALFGRKNSVDVKIADILDNLSDMPPEKESLRPRYEAALKVLRRAADGLI